MHYTISISNSFTTVLYWLQRESSVKFSMHTNTYVQHFNIQTYKDNLQKYDSTRI